MKDFDEALALVLDGLAPLGAETSRCVRPPGA